MAKRKAPATGPTFVIPAAPPKKGSGYTSPIPDLISVVNNPDDHGQDYQGKVGSSVVAIGNATVTSVTPDPTGFGMMIIYTLTSGKSVGTQIYVGHAQPVAGLHDGSVVPQGSPVATLVPAGTIPGSNASQDGWAEIGIAENGQPKYPHGTVGAAELKKVLGLKLTPTETAAASTYQSTVTATTQAGSTGYLTAEAARAAALAGAKATAHIGAEAWVTVLKNKRGQVTGFGQSTGFTAPANAVMYAGQPLTHNLLSQFWNSTYQNDFEQYTGRQPTAAEVLNIIESGKTPYALRSEWAQQPGFVNSPVYKASGPGLALASKQILGAPAPKPLIAQAIAQNWDTNTFEAHLRTLPSYQQGPEFQQNHGQLLGVYKSIYGAPDQTAAESIKQHALNGWTGTTFGTYLRQQPQYKTSPEYRESVLNFLDGMGLTMGSRPVLKVGADGQLTPSLPAAPTLTPAAPTPAQTAPPPAATPQQLKMAV